VVVVARQLDAVSPAVITVNLLEADPDEAVPALIQALQSTLLRTEAAEALTQFGQAAMNPLLKLLKTTKNDNLRRHVLESLAQLGWRPGQIRL